MENRPLLAANWKLNPVSAGEAIELVKGVLEAAGGQGAADVVLFPPFVWLLGVAELVADTPVGLGGQDCFWEPSGAFTGEVSPQMLAGAGCGWVIVGHSERRALGETDEQVARKTAAALSAGLNAIICVGETAEQHDAGQAAEVVERQVKAALEGTGADEAARVVFAYEPIWAIGTGRSADPEHAYRIMRLVRMAAGAVIGKRAVERLRVLYGGSVNRENVASYVELPSCDGCLVGGASLKAEEFSDMIRQVAAVYAPSAG